MPARKDSVKVPGPSRDKTQPKPPKPNPKGDPKKIPAPGKLAPLKGKTKGNSGVTYNVRVKPKGPQSMLAAPYRVEKRTVKTSRGR